jgi:hypothetical protein
MSFFNYKLQLMQMSSDVGLNDFREHTRDNYILNMLMVKGPR